MKINKIILKENTDWENPSQALYINDKRSYSVCNLNEYPEDAIIGRDLIDCYDLLEMLKLGYEMHKNGEELVVEFKEEK